MPKNKEPQAEASTQEQFQYKMSELSWITDEVLRVPGTVALKAIPGDVATLTIPIRDGIPVSKVLMAISIAAIDLAEQLL